MNILHTLAMWPRNLGEHIGRAIGEIVDATPSKPWDCDVEQITREWMTQKERLRSRRYDRSYRKRKIENVDSAMLHIIDVKGGVGAWRTDIKRHQAEGASYDEAKIEAQADRLAKQFPYHAVDAKALVYAHAPEWWTPAGNLGNSNCVHFAIDKASEDVLDVERFQRRFHAALVRWRGMCPSLTYVVTHRQTNAMRGGDPGEAVCRAASPVMDDVGLTWRQSWTKGTGRPMPKEWLL